MNFPMSLGKRLKRLRLQRNLSHNDVAKFLGHRSTGYIAEVEAGEFAPTEKRLRKIAQALKMSWEEIQRVVLEARLEELGFKSEELILLLAEVRDWREEDLACLVAFLKALKVGRSRVNRRRDA